MNLVVSREDKSPFLNSWSYRFHFIIVNYWILNMFMGFFVFYVKIFRADFLMLIKFFNETTVIMYRRESSRRTETKKLFIKLAANGYRELIGSGAFFLLFYPSHWADFMTAEVSPWHGSSWAHLELTERWNSDKTWTTQDFEDDYRAGCRNVSHCQQILFRTRFTWTIMLNLPMKRHKLKMVWYYDNELRQP